MPAVTECPVRNGVGCPVSRAWWSAAASRCGTLSTTHTIAAPNVTRAAVRAAPDSTPLRARPSMPGTSSATNTRMKMCDGTHSGSSISAATAASPDSVGSPIGCSRLPRNPRIPPTSSSHGHRVRHIAVTGGRRRPPGSCSWTRAWTSLLSPLLAGHLPASGTVGSAVDRRHPGCARDPVRARPRAGCLQCRHRGRAAARRASSVQATRAGSRVPAATDASRTTASPSAANNRSDPVTAAKKPASLPVAMTTGRKTTNM